MSAALFLMLGAFFTAAAIRVPIGYAMIGSGVLYLAVTGKDIGLAGEHADDLGVVVAHAPDLDDGGVFEGFDGGADEGHGGRSREGWGRN